MTSILRHIHPAAVLGAVLLAIWQATAMAGSLPGPAAVLVALVHNSGFFARHAAISLAETLAGLLLALAAAFLVASTAVLREWVGRAVLPLAVFSQTIPLVAIAPLVAEFLGAGIFPVVLLTAWLCWFPAVVAFFHGLRDVPADELTVLRLANATPWQIYRHLRLPNAVPELLAGVRASAGFALIGTLVAEYSSAKAGLGAAIIQHVSGVHVLAADQLFALVLVCAFLGVAVTWASYTAAGLVIAKLLRRA